jgi:signal transduction histidine kinase
MKLSFRLRIVLTLIPLLVLLALLGGSATLLLYRLDDRIDAILRENYNSVVYMQGLREATERIDSSFQFALAGKEDQALKDYGPNWKLFDKNLQEERNNITLPGEGEAVAKLTALAKDYHTKGDTFFALRVLPLGSSLRKVSYFGDNGLLDTFHKIKKVSGEILSMNQTNMQVEKEEVQRSARQSLFGFAIGLAVAVALAVWLAWNTTRATLRPIQAVTRSALAIGRGELDQVVPVLSGDELGQLADAFNSMARHLREYRESRMARLLRAQQTTRATIDAFPDPIVVVDSTGQVEMANPAARRLLGAADQPERDGMAGKVAVPWRPPAELEGPLREALHEQRPYLPEGFDRAVRVVADGQEHFLLPHILPIAVPSHGTLGAAVLLQDVTRFRLLDQVKSDLVATASHELKTPLTSLRLALHILLEESVGPLTPKQTELLLDARDNGERLLHMVNNLLDLARLEKGGQHLDLKPERPAELVRGVLDSFQPRAEDKGVEVDVEVAEDLPEVAADAPRLRHALSNLLDNALAYTEAGGHIRIGAEAADGTVALTISDTGIGIPPEYLPHVFERFFRIPGRSQGGGSGLGLAIVREIMTAHGGAVSCDSRPGQGATFRLVLPRAG